MSSKRKSESDSDEDMPLGKLAAKKRQSYDWSPSFSNKPLPAVFTKNKFDSSDDDDDDELPLGMLLAKKRLSSGSSPSIPIKPSLVKLNSNSENESDSSDDLPLGKLVAKKRLSSGSSPSFSAKPVTIKSSFQFKNQSESSDDDDDNLPLKFLAKPRTPFGQLQPNQIKAREQKQASQVKLRKDLNRILHYLEVSERKLQEEEKKRCHKPLLKGIYEFTPNKFFLTRDEIENKVNEFDFYEDESDYDECNLESVQCIDLARSPVIGLDKLENMTIFLAKKSSSKRK